MALPDGRVAIFVDGENLSASCAEAILSIGARCRSGSRVQAAQDSAIAVDHFGILEEI